MFRTKRNYNCNESTKRKPSIIFNCSNNSSIDDCYNIKNNIRKLKQKKSKNIVALNIKTLPNYISQKNSKILKKDIISNYNNLTINKKKFENLTDLNYNKKIIYNKLCTEIRYNSKSNKNNSSRTLMSKNSLKKKYFNIKNKYFKNLIKNNKSKKVSKKNPIIINKFNILELNNLSSNIAIDKCITPKNIIKSYKINLNNITLDTNLLKFNYSYLDNTINNMNKLYNKNNFSKRKSKKNISVIKYNNISKPKYKSISKKPEKLTEIVINNSNISNKINKIEFEKSFSVIYPYSLRKNKSVSSPNNMNLIKDKNNYSYCQKRKKKNILLNILNMEKNKYKIKHIHNKKIQSAKSYKNNYNKIINNFYCYKRDKYDINNKNNFLDYNISTEYTSTEKKNNSNIIIHRIINPITFGLFNFTVNNYQKNNIIYNGSNTKLFKEKMNNNNYKKLLDEIQMRMKFLINNMNNYIEQLKANK